MELNELKELLERLQGIEDYNTEDYFRKIVEAVEDYTDKYQRLYDDIVDETQVIDNIHSLYNLDDIAYYIEDIDTSCGLWRDGSYLSNVYIEDVTEIKEDIITELESEIEAKEKSSIKNKIIYEIEQYFIENNISLVTKDEWGLDSLVDRLLDKFEIIEKENENGESSI